MDIKTLLDDEIQSKFEKLNGMEVDSDSYGVAVDRLTKLVDRSIEMEKIDIDHQERVKDREAESGLKVQEMDEDRKDRLIKNCLTGLGIVTSVGLTVWGTLKSLKFEEDGTVTTIMGRGFINKLLPKK